MVARSRRRRLIAQLLRSSEPSVRWRTRVQVLGESRSSPAVERLETQVRASARVRLLLTEGRKEHRAGHFGGIYRYWQGIHWALTALVDLGYPRADPALRPILERSLGMWTLPLYDRTIPLSTPGEWTSRGGVPLLNGRYRRCASQQGNALLYATALGVRDSRIPRLAGWLQRWQWEDGGWNCARSPNAHVSSFMETLAAMRGLSAFAARTGSSRARRAADRAAEVFLERRLFRRKSTGEVMRSDFLRLHYPLYWHYDVLGGLKGMRELGKLQDPRCTEALEWLERRELEVGGWPADSSYYRVSESYRRGCEYVDWGPTDSRHLNEWITTDALAVLRASERLDL